MKNLFLGLFFTLILLPQLSFGATNPVVVNPTAFVNPQVQSCNLQLSAESNAFFQGQASERGAFLKANPTIIAKHDLRFQENHAIQVARLFGRDTSKLPVPDPEDPAFTAFFAKQQADKLAFLAKLAQDKQSCLGPTAIANPSGT